MTLPVSMVIVTIGCDIVNTSVFMILFVKIFCNSKLTDFLFGENTITNQIIRQERSELALGITGQMQIIAGKG